MGAKFGTKILAKFQTRQVETTGRQERARVRPHIQGCRRWPGSTVVPAGPNKFPTWQAQREPAPPPAQHGGFGRPKQKPAWGVQPYVPGRWRWPGSSVVPAGPNQFTTWTAPSKSARPPRAAWWICQAQTKAGPGRAASCPRVSGGSSGACSNHRVFALNNNSRTSSHMARPRAQKGKEPI